MLSLLLSQMRMGIWAIIITVILFWLGFIVYYYRNEKMRGTNSHLQQKFSVGPQKPARQEQIASSMKDRAPTNGKIKDDPKTVSFDEQVQVMLYEDLTPITSTASTQTHNNQSYHQN